MTCQKNLTWSFSYPNRLAKAVTEQPTAAAFLDEVTFERVFKAHYAGLHAYAHVMLKDTESAEESVQTVFLNLWEKRYNLQINISLKAYLYKAVYHQSLNQMKHRKVRQRYEEASLKASQEASQRIEGEEIELQDRIRATLEALPEKCRMVFQLSRFEELKYTEIAERMGISLKTVEAHMSKALKTLRTDLAEFLPLAILIIEILLHTWNL